MPVAAELRSSPGLLPAIGSTALRGELRLEACEVIPNQLLGFRERMVSSISRSLVPNSKPCPRSPLVKGIPPAPRRVLPVPALVVLPETLQATVPNRLIPRDQGAFGKHDPNRYDWQRSKDEIRKREIVSLDDRLLVIPEPELERGLVDIPVSTLSRSGGNSLPDIDRNLGVRDRLVLRNLSPVVERVDSRPFDQTT